MWLLPLIEGMEVLPNIPHIRPLGVGHTQGRVPIPTFQYGVRYVGVRPYHGRLQTCPDLCCCLLHSPSGVCQKGPDYVSSEPPHHVLTVAGVLTQSCTLINQPDGILGHPEGARGSFLLGGDQFQSSEGLEISVGPAKFRGGGESERYFYPFQEVTVVSTGRATE